MQRAVVVAPPRRCQPDESVAVHGQHRHATDHVLQLSVGAAPVQPFAYHLREGEPMAGGIGDGGADQLKLLLAEGSYTTTLPFVKRDLIVTFRDRKVILCRECQYALD